MTIQLFFFLFLFSGYFCSVDSCVVCIVSGCLISLPLRFLWSLLVVVSMHQRNLKCWCVLFLFLFLANTVCLRHLWDVNPYALSCVFLFSNLFVGVLLWSTLRMVPSILRGRVTAQVLIPLMTFLLCSLVSSCFLVLLRYF